MSRDLDLFGRRRRKPKMRAPRKKERPSVDGGRDAPWRVCELGRTRRRHGPPEERPMIEPSDSGK